MTFRCAAPGLQEMLSTKKESNRAFFRFLGERTRTVSESKLFARRCQTAPVGLISAVSTVGERAPRT